MDLQGLRIKKLFGQFDYNISFNQKDGITILTGPNGYGKTTILNIVQGLFLADFEFFQRLIFETIIFIFSGDKNLSITKGKSENIYQQVVQLINGQQHITRQPKIFVHLRLALKIKDQLIEEYLFTPIEEKKLLQNSAKNLPLTQIAQGMLQDILKTPLSSKYELDTESLRVQIQKTAFEILFNSSNNSNQHQNIRSLLLSTDVYYIKDQRLMKQVTIIGPNNQSAPPPVTLAYTILSLAQDLKTRIAAKQAEAFQVGQQLDSTLLIRSFKPQGNLTKNDFDLRVEKLIAKQKRLQEYGITISISEIPEYNEKKDDVLNVYLEDSEKKAAVFDDLVAKINLFVAALEEKKLTHKKIKIDSINGFSVETDKKEIVPLHLLSSGEQHEIILLYELLFKTESNTLVLVDEPETSLHVAWQKLFLKDIIEISKIQHIYFIIATHSPQIISGRWDLTSDLWDNSQQKSEVVVNEQ